MFGNNTFSINLMANNITIENDVGGQRLYNKLRPEKFS